VTRRVGLAALVAVLLSCAPARAHVNVSTDPWGVSFATGAATLTEDSLGFEVAGVRYHGTSATDLGGGRYTVATNDPAGRTIDVRVSRDGDGIDKVVATVAGAPVTKT
jgi:hypothetical protein